MAHLHPSAAASAYWTAIIERLIELEDRLPPFDTVIIDEGRLLNQNSTPTPGS